MKKYTLAIDMSYFSPTHLGGKDETAFNLLRGFEEMGVSKDIICLCSNNMHPVCIHTRSRSYIFMVLKLKE